jgi:hypothetical protein
VHLRFQGLELGLAGEDGELQRLLLGPAPALHREDDVVDRRGQDVEHRTRGEERSRVRAVEPWQIGDGQRGPEQARGLDARVDPDEARGERGRAVRGREPGQGRLPDGKCPAEVPRGKEEREEDDGLRHRDRRRERERDRVGRAGEDTCHHRRERQRGGRVGEEAPPVREDGVHVSGR